jgi:hypothetical protein
MWKVMALPFQLQVSQQVCEQPWAADTGLTMMGVIRRQFARIGIFFRKSPIFCKSEKSGRILAKIGECNHYFPIAISVANVS